MPSSSRWQEHAVGARLNLEHVRVGAVDANPRTGRPYLARPIAAPRSNSARNCSAPPWAPCARPTPTSNTTSARTHRDLEPHATGAPASIPEAFGPATLAATSAADAPPQPIPER